MDAYTHRDPEEPKKVIAALKRLHRYLEPVDSEVPFRQIVKRLSRRAALLDAGLSAQVKEQHRQIQGLLHEVSVAQQNERKRVGITIHDGVAQWMTAAFYGINTCEALLSESRLEELEAELARVRKILRRSVTELRRAIADLRPLPLEELGLVVAIRKAAETLEEEGIACRTEFDGDVPELTLTEETSTYWIVQEVLTNVRNHSGAATVSLRARFRDDRVSVEISDDGQGFSPGETGNGETHRQRMGLVGMQERVRLLGGHLAIDSSAGRGTTIAFDFPTASRLAGAAKA